MKRREIVFLNGDFLPGDEAKISVFDRGFLLGDGLFETLRVHAGRIVLLKEHLDRLFTGARLLEIPVPLDQTQFQSAIEALLRYNDLTDAAIRITLTRGVNSPGLVPQCPVTPTLVITARSYPPLDLELPKGICAMLIEYPLPQHPYLSSCKTTNMLPYLLGAKAYQKTNAQEGFFLNSAGILLEGTVSNLFLVDKNGVLKTPAITLNILPGVMRGAVMNIALNLGIPVAEGFLDRDDLFTAREVFRTNSLIVIEPVDRVNEYIVGDGKKEMTRTIYQTYLNFVAS